MARLTGKNALICGDARSILVGPVPFDITGYTVTFTVKAPTALSSSSDAGAVIQKAVSSHTSQYNTVIALSSEDTRIPAGKYVYDIQFSDGNPDHTTSSRPQEIEFIEDVTKS